MVPELLWFTYIFFFFCEFKEVNYCCLGGLFLCISASLYFVRSYHLLLAWSLDICCLFLQCEQAVTSLIGHECISMEKEAVVGGQTFPRLYQDFTLKELLGELMNIRIISAPGQKSRISEITGRQKEIFARVGVPLPVEEVYAV